MWHIYNKLNTQIIDEKLVLSLYLFTCCEQDFCTDAVKAVLEHYPHGETGYQISPESVVIYEDKVAVSSIIFENIFGKELGEIAKHGRSLLVGFHGLYGYHDEALWEWIGNKRGAGLI